MMSSLIMKALKGRRVTPESIARPKWVTMLFAGLLCGCAVGPDFVPPAAVTTDHYLKNADSVQRFSAEGKTQHISTSVSVPYEWWKLFGSTPLNMAVEVALTHNQTLAATEAALRQSEHNVQAAYGVFFPRVSLGADALRERSTPVQNGLNTPGTVYNLVTLNGSVSYLLDVFGGERRTVEALNAEMINQLYLTKAAYLMLSANIVNTMIARAAYAEEIRLNKELISIQRSQLKTTQMQYDSGTVPYSTVLSIQSLIAANEASIAPLQLKLGQTEDLLASLEGVTPAELNLPDLTLNSLVLPVELPLSLPSELVRQRPDILSAEAKLHVASADIGVATAAMYPSISLNGTYGLAGKSLGNLSASNGKFWNIGPSISLPLFQGGSLWYQRQAAIDAFHAAQANYRQTVLTAFAQVGDVLKAIEYDTAALQARADANHAAQQALHLLQANYTAGLASYIEVYTADVLYHQSSIEYLQAVAQRHQDTVALYVALGGGWWNNPVVATDQHQATTGARP